MLKIGDLIQPIQVYKNTDLFIGFVISDIDEYYGLSDCLQDFITAYNLKYTIYISGIGITNALLATIDLYRQGVTSIINIGSAGSIVYAKGMVIQPKYFLQSDHFIMDNHDLDPCKLYTDYMDFKSLQPNEICYSSNSFISSRQQIADLPLVGTYDMEAYGVAVASSKIGREFYCIKIITDNLDYSKHHEELKTQLASTANDVYHNLEDIYKKVKNYYKLED